MFAATEPAHYSVIVDNNMAQEFIKEGFNQYALRIAQVHFWATNKFLAIDKKMIQLPEQFFP
jgi:hypothetical protein